MPRILHVLNVSFVLPYYLGDQISFFDENGYTVFVACSKSEKLDQYLKKWNFTLYSLDIRRKFSPVIDLLAIIKLIKFIRNNNIDVVVGHTPKGALIGMVASYIAGVRRRVYFQHGLMFETSEGLKRDILILVEKVTSNFATSIICVSKSVLDKSVQLNIGDLNKNRLIHYGTCNGIDGVDRFNPSKFDCRQKDDTRSMLNINSEDCIILYVGRLAKDKGINVLVKSWIKISNQRENILLLIAGPMDTRDPLDDDVLRLIKSHEKIRYLGEIEHTEELYATSDLFILPSYREGFPTVVLEASAMGLPVITTKCTGCIDSIIENETGIFIEISEDEIARAINFYLDNVRLRKLHGIQGRNFVLQNFDRNSIWTKLEEVYFK